MSTQYQVNILNGNGEISDVVCVTESKKEAYRMYNLPCYKREIMVIESDGDTIASKGYKSALEKGGWLVKSKGN